MADGQTVRVYNSKGDMYDIPPDKLDKFTQNGFRQLKATPQQPSAQPQQPQGSAVGRYAKGVMAAPTAAVTAPFKPETYKSMGQNWIKELMAMVGGPSTRQQMTQKMEGESKAAGGAGALVDIPNIKKDWQSGNKAGALGRATTQAALLGSGLRRTIPEAQTGKALEEAEAVGSQLGKDDFLSTAKVVTKPQSQVLDQAMSGFEARMEHEVIDSQRLGAGIAYFNKRVTTAARNLPESQVGAVNAAKAVVEDLNKSVKANPKIMPWNEARRISDRLGQASAQVKDVVVKNALKQIKEAVDEPVQASADKAGIGWAFKKWNQDYRSLSNVQRARAKVYRGRTDPQLQSRATAKKSLFSSRESKVAETNKAALKRNDQAIKELDARIKTKGRYEPDADKGSPESDIEQARRQR